MKGMLAGALAVLTISFAGAASATVCTTSCDHDYGVCNTVNGGSAQQICMPKWFQCKKSCSAPAKAPVRVSNVTPKPHG